MVNKTVMVVTSILESISFINQTIIANVTANTAEDSTSFKTNCFNTKLKQYFQQFKAKLQLHMPKLSSVIAI